MSTYIPKKIEIKLKDYLLKKFKHHFETKISKQQKDAILIAAFLDPCVFRILNDDQIEAAKTLIKAKKRLFESHSKTE